MNCKDLISMGYMSGLEEPHQGMAGNEEHRPVDDIQVLRTRLLRILGRFWDPRQTFAQNCLFASW